MGKLASRVASGSLWLSLGQFLSLIVSFIGGAVIARLLGPGDYGYVAAAQTIALMVYGFVDLGLYTAILRYTSMDKKTHSSTAFTLRVLAGVTATVLLYMFSTSVSDIVEKKGLGELVRVLSLYVLGFTVIDSAKAVLIGVGEYYRAAVLDSLRSGLRVGIAVALILVGLGAYGAVLGFTLSTLVVSIIALQLVYTNVSLRMVSPRAVLEVMAYSLPLYLPLLLGAPLGKVVDFYLIRYVSSEDFANYSIAMNLYMLVIFVTNAIASSIFSTISSIIDDWEKVKSIIPRLAVYTTSIVAPLSISLIVLAEPIVGSIYGHQYNRSPTYLALIGVRGLYVVLGYLASVPLIKSVGHTSIISLASIIHTVVYVPLAVILISKMGIYGLLLSLIVSDIIPPILYTFFVYKKYSIRIPLLRNLLTTAVFILASTPAYFSHAYLLASQNYYVRLAVGAALLLAFYVIAYAVVFTRKELEELRSAVVTGLPSPLRKPVSALFDATLYIRRRISFNELKHG